MKINMQTWLPITLIVILTLSPVLPSLAPIQLFGGLEAEASPILWDGEGEDGLWSNPQNWEGNQLPSEKDIAIFSNELPFPATIDGEEAVIGGIEITQDFIGQIILSEETSLHVGSEGFRQASGRFKGSQGQMTIDGSLHISDGEFIAPESILNISGNISVLKSTSFKHNAGTIELIGHDQIIHGNIAFNNLTKKTLIRDILTFQSGKTIRADGTLTLEGTAAINNEKEGTNHLTINASTENEPVSINPTGEVNVSHVTVRDLINTSPITIACAENCVNGGNVSGWEGLQDPEQENRPISTPIPALANLLEQAQPGRVAGETSTTTETLEEKQTVDFAADEPIEFILDIKIEEKSIELTPAETDIESASLSVSSEEGGKQEKVIEKEENQPEIAPEGHTEENLEGVKVEEENQTSHTPRAIFGALTRYITGHPAHAQEIKASQTITAILTDPKGEQNTIVPEISTIDGNTVITVAEPSSEFVPGMYTLNINVEQNGSTYNHTQDFSWGVLAMNFDQSSYRIDEEVGIGIGVLDDRGRTLCSADVSIQVTDPKSTIHTLTANASTECGPRSVTNEPDYKGLFTPSMIGEYAVAVTAQTKNGVRSMTEEFEVNDTTPFIIRRNSATRIYPPEDYTMNIEIEAKADFTGTMTDRIPESFTIVSGATTKEVDLKAGEKTVLEYTYDAPDVSPEFYLLGPLQVTSLENITWQEPKTWQVAADATFNDAATGNWNIGTTWGGGCSSSCTEGTDYPGISDTTTIDSHTVTLTATHSTDDITLATGGTLSAGSNTLRVAGFWNNTGGTFTESTGTVMFTSASDETITANSDDFNNVIINDGLIGYFKMDEGSDNTCTGGSNDLCDSSGYNNDGAIQNGDSDEWSSSTGSTNFTNSNSTDFDGTNDWVDTGIWTNYGSSDFTVAAWINVNDTANSKTIFDQDTGGTPYMSIWVNGSNGVVSASGRNTVADGIFNVGGTTDVEGAGWVHAVVLRNGADIDIYVNGIREHNNNVATGSYTSGGTDAIGTNWNGGSTRSYMDGLIDDLRVYNRALSAQEITALAAGNQPATENTAASEFSLSGALDVDGDLIINSGELDADADITVAGDWQNNGGIFSRQTNTVTLDGSTSSQEFQSGGQNFYNLTVSGSGGWDLHDRLEVDNALSQSAGTLDTTTNNYNMTITDWDQTAGTFTDNSSTLTLNSVAAQTVNFEDSVYNLQIEDPTEDSLVGYWKLDEGQTASTTDSSTNSNTGTLTNSPKWSTTTNSTTTYDNPGSIEFDGSDDYVDIGDTSQTSVKTIAFWMNADDVTTRELIDVDGTDLIEINGSSDVVATSFPASTVYINGSASTAVSADTWTHVLVTDSTGVNASNFDIGRAGGSNQFDGHLDDVRIYSKVLSAAEITAVAAGKYADGDNSTATYTLNTSLDVDNNVSLQSGILDVSGTDHAITVANNWNGYAGSSGFTGRTGTVTLDGTNQAINGDTTFYNLAKTDSSNNSTDETVTVEASSDNAITNLFNFTGLDDNDRVNLVSSTGSTQFTLTPTYQQVVYWLDVTDSATATSNIACQQCVNGGGNDDAAAAPHWLFGSGSGRQRIRTSNGD